ncbi:unnamed protein product [Protopolystoma xenopodis]|uniref:Uncharacterized protein n=1 Tax=Protopolystoma xenopodis TaxID=117903 RepID=A0A448X8R8_9PLAT|nr:unnamed protein product [Protopolystoma xenopodis]
MGLYDDEDEEAEDEDAEGETDNGAEHEAICDTSSDPSIGEIELPHREISECSDRILYDGTNSDLLPLPGYKMSNELRRLNSSPIEASLYEDDESILKVDENRDVDCDLKTEVKCESHDRIELNLGSENTEGLFCSLGKYRSTILPA